MADTTITTGLWTWFGSFCCACTVPQPFDMWAACGMMSGAILMVIGRVLAVRGGKRG